MKQNFGLSVLALGVLTAVNAIRDGFKSELVKEPSPEPVPDTDPGVDALLDAIEKQAETKPHYLVRLQKEIRGEPYEQLWADGKLVYSERWYALDLTNMDTEVKIWEDKLGVKCIKARAKPKYMKA